MALKEDIISFPGDDGLDYDSAIRSVSAGDSRTRRNFRTGSQAGDFGDGVSLPGNINAINLIINTARGVTIPAGSKCIGTFEEYLTKRHYFFIYNTNPELHSIYYIDYISAYAVYLVLQHPLLNFHPDYLITHVDMVNGWLLWTDGYNEPRKLNVSKAIAYTAGVTTPVRDVYLTMSNQILSACPYAPMIAPLVEFKTDLALDTNFLNGKIWQFAYRYIYDDKSVSPLSPYSNMVKPDHEVVGYGDITDDINRDNYLTLSLNVGADEIHYIEVFCRNIYGQSWKLIKSLKRYNDDGTVNISSGYYDLDLYGNETLIEVASDDVLENNVLMPVIAGTQVFTTENVLVYGDVQQGYPKTEIDAVFYPLHSQTPYDRFIIWADHPHPDSSSGSGVIWSDHLGGTISIFASSTLPPVGSIIFLQPNPPPTGPMHMLHNNANEYYVVTAADTIYSSIADLLVARFGVTKISDTTVRWDLAPTYLFGYQKPDPYRFTLKDGAWHSFGLVYYDAQGRPGPLNLPSPHSVYIPAMNETYVGGSTVTGILRNWVSWTLNSNPPSWAAYYQWYHYREQVDTYLRIECEQSYDPVTQKLTFLIYNRLFDTRSLVKDTRDAIIWDTVVGDRIRVLGEVGYNGFYGPAEFITVDTSYNLEFDVIEVEPNGDPVVIGSKSEAASYTTQRVLIEIYRLKPVTDEKVYTPIDDMNTITSGVHDKITGSIFGDETFTILRNYSYHFGSSVYVVYGSWTESDHYSDLFESRRPIGKVGVESQYEYELRLTNKLVSGGKIFFNTMINDIFNFNSGDEHYLPIANGAVKCLRQVGYTLKCLQEAGMRSIYLARAMMYDDQGEQSLIRTTDFFGSSTDSVDKYGCVNPESVVVNGRMLVWFDYKNGIVVFDAGNGQEPISSAKMNTYFKGKKAEFEYYFGSLRVVGYYDPNSTEVGFTFINHYDEWESPPPPGQDVLPSETMVGNLAYKRWKYNADYLPEFYCVGGFGFTSFKDGVPYVHGHPSASPNTFFGVAYASVFDVIFTENSAVDKDYRSLTLQADAALGCNTYGDVTSYVSGGNPGGDMQTRIPTSRFKRANGLLHADIPRDINTPNGKSNDFNMINGRPMMGEVLSVKFTSEPGESVRVTSIRVKTTETKRN